MSKILHLDFIPRNTDLGLLLLRLWLGLSMAILHGWGKVSALVSGKIMFDKPVIGLGATPEFVLATFAEFACALLVAMGLLTRFAALFLIVTMSVAFFVAHGRALSGPGSGEIAFLYLAGFIAIFVAGPGKYSVDRK